jgi:hypothetical protein
LNKSGLQRICDRQGIVGIRCYSEEADYIVWQLELNWGTDQEFFTPADKVFLFAASTAPLMTCAEGLRSQRFQSSCQKIFPFLASGSSGTYGQPALPSPDCSDGQPKIPRFHAARKTYSLRSPGISGEVAYQDYRFKWMSELIPHACLSVLRQTSSLIRRCTGKPVRTKIYAHG